VFVACFLDKIAKNNFKYPADRAKGKSEKYTAYEATVAAVSDAPATASVVELDSVPYRGGNGDDDSTSVKNN
jgi:hypothetical protein